ncbi:MAG TPA: hypothetical protein VEI52_22675 [Terriglobales bacterium]|nr:hypothetical protein [Terriglobales bacterium]
MARTLLQAQGRLILTEHLQLQQTFDPNNAHLIEGLAGLPLHDSVTEWEKFRISGVLQKSGNQSSFVLGGAPLELRQIGPPSKMNASPRGSLFRYLLRNLVS